MRENIEHYARGLEDLSLEDLSRGAEELVSRERQHTADLIAHLAEISRRKGHLELGYRSLFEYCQKVLRLSEGAVWRRTQVARVSRRFPQVLACLAEGKVSLSSLGVLAPEVSEENVDELLKEAEGKTKAQVKEIVAALRPKPAAGPMIRRKPVRSGGESPERGAGGARGVQPGLSLSGAAREVEPRRVEGSVEAARPEVYNFRFSAGKSLREKLERLAEVLGVEGAARNMPKIIEKALDIALAKRDPKQKLQRRRKREAARSRTRPGEAVAGERKRETPGRDVRGRARYIPSSVRERLLERAGYQCEYTGPGGIRCTARTRLEVDHIQPLEKGGGRGEENLRILCRAHNLLAADREFGAEFMRGRIERAKIGGRNAEQRGGDVNDTAASGVSTTVPEALPSPSLVAASDCPAAGQGCVPLRSLLRDG
jgi:5-methylcytosine-specific restriction endonuclease McrA